MKASPAAAGIFKPAPSRSESKNDATDRAAREIIAAEATATEVKTAKLRAARLAREAEQAANPPPVAEAPVKKRKKAAPKSL